MSDADVFCLLLQQLAAERNRELTELRLERDQLLERFGLNQDCLKKWTAFMPPAVIPRPFDWEIPVEEPPVVECKLELCTCMDECHTIGKSSARLSATNAITGTDAHAGASTSLLSPSHGAGDGGCVPRAPTKDMVGLHATSSTRIPEDVTFSKEGSLRSRNSGRNSMFSETAEAVTSEANTSRSGTSLRPSLHPSSTFSADAMREKLGLQQPTLWQRLVDRDEFDIMVGVFVFFSTILLGLRTHDEAKGKTDLSTYDLMEQLCNIVFTIELMLRILARGRSFFGRMHRLWSCLDTMLVFVAWAELLAFASTENLNNANLTRIVRVLRLARVVRVVKVVRAMTEVRTILFQIWGSFLCLAWVLLILVGLIYVFAIPLTSGAAVYIDSEEFQQVDSNLVVDYFGDVLKTMYTLFLSITNGNSWGEAAGILQNVGMPYFLLFLSYISLAVFSILNVVTGVFVDCAMQCADRDRAVRARRAKKNARMVKDSMLELMRIIDTDSNGTVSIEEWLTMVHIPVVHEMLLELDINEVDLQDAFELLDVDGDGELSVDELLDGLMAIKGNARSIHQHSLLKMVGKLKYSVEEILRQFKDRDSTRDARRQHVGLRHDSDSFEEESVL